MHKMFFRRLEYTYDEEDSYHTEVYDNAPFSPTDYQPIMIKKSLFEETIKNTLTFEAWENIKNYDRRKFYLQRLLDKLFTNNKDLINLKLEIINRESYTPTKLGEVYIPFTLTFSEVKYLKTTPQSQKAGWQLAWKRLLDAYNNIVLGDPDGIEKWIFRFDNHQNNNDSNNEETLNWIKGFNKD